MSKQAPDKFLIFSILAAALIVAGAILFVTMKNNAGGVQTSANGGRAPKAAMTTYNEQIIIEPALQGCTKDEKCIVVDTTCSFCCKYVAINAKFEQLFNQLFDGSCGGYKGDMCQCFDLGSYPSCVNGKCQLVKWEDEKKK